MKFASFLLAGTFTLSACSSTETEPKSNPAQVEIDDKLEFAQFIYSACEALDHLLENSELYRFYITDEFMRLGIAQTPEEAIEKAKEFCPSLTLEI